MNEKMKNKLMSSHTITMRRFFLMAITSALAVVLFFSGRFFWSQANIEKVSERAEAIAGSQPYCIQVADNDDYKEARTLSSLSGINMRASGPPYWTHHAILVVGARLFHWSYHKQDFMLGAINEPAISCTPRLHFVKTLPAFSASDPVSLNANVAGMTFSVPAIYRARIHGGSSRSESGPGILFYATPPNFSPIEETKLPGAQRPIGYDVNRIVEVDFRRTNRPRVWLTVADQSHIVENSKETFDLKKHLVWYVDSPNRVRTRLPHFEYFSEVNGHVVTLIRCPEGIKVECMHTFYHNDWTYTFKHSSVDLPHWKIMQQSLVTLTNSFLIKNEAASLPQ